MKISDELKERDYQAIKSIVANSVGIKLTKKKKSLIVSRLSKRINELGLKGFSQYIEYIQNNLNEKQRMLNLITTNVTHFFRENSHFEYLKKIYLPKLKTNNIKYIRAWSAGCSTGEEPYSLGIAVKEFFNDSIRIRILGSDVNTEVLDFARRGIKKKKKIEDIPYNLLKKYFKMGISKNRGLFMVNRQLKSITKFKKINLIQQSDYKIKKESLHIIFCRNVFIYFNKNIQKKILNNFAKFLTTGGLLFLGHSEKIELDETNNQWKQIKPTIYQKIN